MMDKNFIKALKRLIYINEDLKYQNDIDIKIFQTEEEVNLYKCSQNFTKFEKKTNFLDNKKFVISFTNALNQFFDNVKVNSEDKKLKKIERL